MNIIKSAIAGFVLAWGLSGGVMAGVVIAGNAPFTGGASGQQSDANSAPYSQNFATPQGAVIESITWWGFHGQDSMGSDFDNFLVSLGGVVQTGTLAVTPVFDFYMYVLDIADTALTATSLSIVNDSFDVEWYWQSAAAVGNTDAADAFATAFHLIGQLPQEPGNKVPEPQTLLLVLGALGVLSMSRTNAKQGCSA